MPLSFPHYRQHDVMDCGPTCLQIISKFYGKLFNIEKIRLSSQIGKTGVSLLGISRAAEKLGIKAMGGNMTFDKLTQHAQLPCIIHWRKNHFVVLYKIKRNKVYISDPASGLHTYSKEEFLQNWAYTSVHNQAAGIVMLLQPTPAFYQAEDDGPATRAGIGQLLRHVWQYQALLRQLLAGLVVGALIQLALPLLTKGLVDVGIKRHDLNFVYVILFGQLLITLGQTSVELIRGWILLHITARMNVAVLSEFLHKLLRLPLSFFDTKLTSDILQRIEDHNRIEALLTGSSLNTLFSMLTFSMFGVVLYFYSPLICGILLGGSALYFTWSHLFLSRRKLLDFKRFGIAAQNRAKVLQLINGVYEIKINDCGVQKVWEWESIQAKLFHFNVRSLALTQYQQVGATFINQAKNVLILFVAARLVMNQQMSLGDMMAVQFIVGQMNGPIAQLATFMQTYQDAKVSLERLGQVHMLDDEEDATKDYVPELPARRGLHLEQLSFVYPGAGNQPVLKNLSFSVPAGKTTAIVGASGSGKTTLLKLLLRICNPTTGQVLVDALPLERLSPQHWRQHCGIVMQDGFIFSDTIGNNIAINAEYRNQAALAHALHVANLDQYVNSLPLGLHTKIGEDGKGLSGGQRQRVLIARMVYKNPDYIFLDEATSALDAHNERVIMERLNAFFQGKTVVIVAHRLSTVKNADNIIVLHNGEVREQGSHEELVSNRGYYFELIKNQLELGN
ncbi:peptidase domain-containing ABC transporter [Hymenobacter sp. PAMC29290]|nr:peptidase domain-containing ABC transporter [Hymenobacter siberiensis]MBU6120255.1 peptidase domain-containing ABC transporter [Hymenobacter siberiensis]